MFWNCNQFPMDDMHVVYLGVMRALNQSLVQRSETPYSINSSKIKIFNLRFIEIRNDVPHEF